MTDTDSIKQLIDTAVSGYNGEQVAADGGSRVETYPED